MKKPLHILSAIAAVFLLPTADVSAYRDNPAGNVAVDKSVSAGCLPPSSYADLSVNNVRALIHSGGDMWWDLGGNARYEVPKGSGRHSLFVGTLWIGGVDQQTQTLKVAAQRYRTTGVDFWTGPLSKGSANIDAETCNLYDRIWSITRSEVELFCLCNSATGTNQDDPSCEGYQIPKSIKEWPGNPSVQGGGQHVLMDNMLAPFADVDSDMVYDATKGDYPFYDLNNSIDCQTSREPLLFGDFTLWWVFNDKGNIHSETQGIPIGMEVRAQGFGFTTNDEINNMTFYNYELINRGTTVLSNCYFGVNTDADIGCADDDYTGCDVQRGFGYMYNGDAYDENCHGQLGYGLNPPAIGIDFFEGPYLDSNGIAEFWDPNWTPGSAPPEAANAIGQLKDTSRWSAAFGINGLGFNDTIEDNERFGMRRFVYYNRGTCNTNCEPENAIDYYNYIRGFWKDGSRMIYGGDGYPSSGTPTQADFMFPGNSDPWNWGTKGTQVPFEWSEQLTGESPNTPFDRRFVQSAGPFTLKPGAVNDITIGVVWARANSGDPYQSVLEVLSADIKAQSLFDNCFRVLDGPDAPDLNIQELDRELILYLTNKPSPISNNYLNGYQEENYFIPASGLVTTAITRDTLMYIPSFDVAIDQSTGDSIFIYGNEVTVPADTLIEIIIAGVPVDTLFGYYSNESTLTLVTLNLGMETDTVHYDQYIRFEGYMIYQVKDATVTAVDIFSDDGNSKARLVAQCDIRNFDENGNPIGKLVNFEYDDLLGENVPHVKVNGSNEGIQHSFRITEDLFATGDKRLVNHKTYYYKAFAYGYNNYKTYNPDDPNALDGQKEPFFLGRNNTTMVYSGIPHIPAPEANGTVINSLYGIGPQITRVEGRGNGGNLLQLTEETEDSILNSADHRLDEITYDYGMGPVKVKVIDPLSIPPKKYLLKIVDTQPQTMQAVNNTAHWVLLDPDDTSGDDTVAISDKDITQAYEQIIYDRRDGKFLGFSISAEQTQNAGPVWQVTDEVVTKQYIPSTTLEINGNAFTTIGNGLIHAEVVYENPSNAWLGFFPDIDGPTPLNWMRGGTFDDQADPTWNSNYFSVDPDNSQLTLNSQKVYYDPEQAFQRGISFYGGGGLVPYALTSAINYYDGSLPAHSLGTPNLISILTTQSSIDRKLDVGNLLLKEDLPPLSSVDIVLTPDRSKWTRCPVFEMQQDNTLSYVDPLFPSGTRPNRLDLRFSPSVDKDGNFADVNAGASNNEEDPNFINAWGMGWFPGYVIDIETGERLNVAYGEDSFLAQMNGRDMKFNPSEADPPGGDNSGWIGPLADYLYAGKHYLYIFGSQPEKDQYDAFPHYDYGKTMMQLATDAGGLPGNIGTLNARNLWRNCMWAGIPFHVKSKVWLGDEVRVRLRVYRSYQSGYSSLQQSAAPQNDNNPMYRFSFEDLAPRTGDNATASSALDLIQIVPNPYYAANDYETDKLDTRVKIVNLPENCVISIYSLSGALVRRYEKGDQSTSLAWDLKNFAGIPVASGLYIVHIKADGIGERIIKWYGVMRAVNLDTF